MPGTKQGKDADRIETDTPDRNADRPRVGIEDRQRKEDYKAYSERDVDEGWPYSDDPGTETDRLSGNRPYPGDTSALAGAARPRNGMHVEESPIDPNEDDDEARSARRSRRARGKPTAK